MNIGALRRRLACGPVLGLLAATALRAATNDADLATDPKWQAGLFLGYARLPHYRGSDAYKEYVVPVPYFIYRGEVVKAGRGGLRGVLFNNLRFDLSVSMSGNPPVDSDEDDARAGMPDLPPLVEAGPALKWWPLGRIDHASLYVELAARGTASIDVQDDWGVAYEGLRSELSLNYRKEFPRPGGKHWRIGGSLSAYAADERYHRYFYDVPADYATATRPAYAARGGYAGAGLSGWITRRLGPRLVAGVFGRVDHLDGAAFEDSPLVRAENNFTAGTALVWTFAESQKRVPRDPTETGN